MQIVKTFNGANKSEVIRGGVTCQISFETLVNSREFKALIGLKPTETVIGLVVDENSISVRLKTV